MLLKFRMGPSGLDRFGLFEKMKVLNRGKRFFSFLHIGGTTPLIYKTMGNILDEAAIKYKDKPAFVSAHQNQRFTFAEVKEKADELASGFLAMGLVPGDRVGLWLPNCTEWYLSSLALGKAGMICVYLNPAYLANELMQCLRSLTVKMLIMSDSFKNVNHLEIIERILPELSSSVPGSLKSLNVPSLKSLVCISDTPHPGIFPFSYIFKSSTDASRKILREIQSKISPDDPVNVQFTSGTTGNPKGAVLTHNNIINNGYFIGRRQLFHEKEHVICLMGPFFHALGCVITLIPSLHNGQTLVTADVSFSAKNVADVILREKVTVLTGTPTMYIDLMHVFKSKGIKPETLELAICGGSYGSVTLFQDMITNLGLQRISSVYGLTEAGPVIFMSTPKDTKQQILETVGLIMNHMEVKVVDENNVVVPFGARGELWVRGYNVMKCYWEDEEKTKSAITQDRWLKTGDQCILRENGYAEVVGRIKDIIIRGGENIFPKDIEEFLNKHPAIMDIQVVGVPDERLGEVVCACIRLHSHATLTEKEVLELCRQEMAAFKIPKYVLFFEDFPRTATGKIQKFKLRELAIEMINSKS